MGMFENLEDWLHSRTVLKKERVVEEEYRRKMHRDMLVQGAITVGNILEISNGYIIILHSSDGTQQVSLYAPNLEKIGEVLAAHKTKNKFLHEPEAFTTNTVKMR